MQVKSAKHQEQRRAHRSCTAHRGRGCGPGPGATRAPPFPLGPLQAAGPNPLRCAALRAACGPPSFWPLRVPSCAGAPAPARVPSGPGRLPPLRGPGPAFCALASLAGAGPRAFPPALSLGPCAPLRGSVASRWPRCAWVALRPLRASAASLWSPLLCSVRPPALRGFPAGSPLARPLSRLRARRLPAPGPARASPACCGLSAPGLCCAGRLRPLLPPAGVPVRPRCLRFRAAWVPLRGSQARCLSADRGLRPCLPPVPAAPSGGSREAEGCALGVPTPAPLARPLWSLLLPLGLTFGPFYGTIGFGRLRRPFLGPPRSGCPWCSRNRLGFARAVLFLPFRRSLRRSDRRSDFRRSTKFTGPGAAFSLEWTVRKLSTAARPSSCGQHKSRSSRSGFSVPPEFADTRILRTFRAAICLFPRRTQQNLCHFVAFIGSQKNCWGWLPNERIRASGPQNNGFAAFAFLTPVSFRQTLHEHHITSRPRCQLIFRPAARRRRLYLAASCMSASA